MIRIHDEPKSPNIPLCLHTTLGPDYYVPPVIHTTRQQPSDIEREKRVPGMYLALGIAHQDIHSCLSSTGMRWSCLLMKTKRKPTNVSSILYSSECLWMTCDKGLGLSTTRYYVHFRLPANRAIGCTKRRKRHKSCAQSTIKLD